MAEKDDTMNDAVSMCSQHAYPGDDELEVLEREIMMQWKLDQAPDVETKPYNKEALQKNTELAHKCLAEGHQSEALRLTESAIGTDSHNSALWLQRATALIATGNLREAFRCCNTIQPAARTADVWKVGGSVLEKLGLVVTAEHWLRYATKYAPKGDNSAATLFQKIRAKRLYEPLTQDMGVEVTFTSQGRAIRTTRAVKKGQVIFMDKPVLLAQTLPTLRFPCCANCVKSLIRPEDVFVDEDLQSNLTLRKAVKKYWPIRERFPCTCTREVYCSEKCREEAWETYHRVICTERNPAMKTLYEVCAKYDSLSSQDCSAFQGWWAASFSPILLARLWAQIVCNADRLARDKGRSIPSAYDWALARAPFRRFIAYGSGIKADSFPKMHQLMAEIFTDLGDGLSYTISKEEFSGRYLQVACNCQSFSDGENPMSYLCRGLHAEGTTTARSLMNHCRQQDHEGDFAGLFAIHACLNHSCDNNAFVSDGKTADGKPGCHVKAKRDIAMGEEVYNQYIDTSMSRPERRLMLYRSYNFWCQCRRCQFEGDDASSCTECHATAHAGHAFPKCSRCKQAWYCSIKCQKKAWKRGHKKICGLEM